MIKVEVFEGLRYKNSGKVKGKNLKANGKKTRKFEKEQRTTT